MALPPPDRGDRKPHRRRQRPYTLPKSHVPEAATRRGRPAPPKRTGVFARPPVGGPDPVQRRVEEARKRSRRARTRLPDLPMPHVPVIRNPTPRQVRAATQRITTGITKTVGPAGSAREQLARRREVEQAYLDNPRMRQAILHYGRAQADRAAVGMARSYGVRGSRRTLVRAGTQILQDRSARDRVAPGPKRALGGVPRTLLATALAQTSLGGSSAENQFVKNIGGDLRALASGPFIGAYEVGAGAKEAVTGGGTGRLEKLGKGAVEGIVESVPGKLVRAPFSDKVSANDALEEWKAHPLIGSLDIAAAASVLGRGAGAFARAAGSAPEAAGVRGGLARFGSTVRPPIALVDDAGAPQLVERRYSKDSVRKGFQAAADRVREPLRGPDGKVVTSRQRGREVPVLKAFEGERGFQQKREADFAASRANSLERMVRDEAGREMRVRGVKGRRAKDLVSMVVEGTITSSKHFAEDLRAHGTRLRGELARHEKAVRDGDTPVYRHSGELKAARDRLELIDKALADPRVLSQAGKIVSAGEEIGRKLNAREREAIQLGLLNPSAASRSRLVPAAVEHLGGRHFTPEEIRALPNEPIVAKHAHAKDAAAAAGETVQLGRARVKRLRAARDRLVGSQRVTRGQDATKGQQAAYHVGERRFATRGEAQAFAKKNGGKVRAVALTGRESARVGELERATRALESGERDLRAAEGRLRDAQKVAQESDPRHIKHGAVRHSDGRFMSNKEIEDFLRSRDRDPETVAYLPHRLDVRGSRAFHTQFRPGGRGTMDKGETRTGEAYRRGVTESSTKLIQEQGVRQATQIAKARQLDRMVGDHGIQRPDGKYFTAKEALEAAQRLEEDAGRPFVAVRAFAAKLDKETQRIIREDLQGPGAMETLGQRLLNDRIVTGPDVPGAARARNVVLVPAEFVEQLQRHLRPAGDIQKFFQMINRPFRFAVLAQPRWLVGQFVEPYIVRLTTTGSGLNVFGLGVDLAAASRTLRGMERSGDPRLRAAAKEMRAQQEGGLAIGGRGLSVRRESDDLKVANAAYGQMVKRLPVVAQGVELVRDIGHVLMAPGNVYFRMNRAIEAVAQRAAIGRDVRRDIQEFSGSWLKSIRLHAKALEEVQQGLVNTSTQRRFLRSQHELLGKYEGFPPWLRELVQGPMPFLPWALNATRFVFWTMPAHRTIQTALLMKVNDVVAKEWQEVHKGTPPGGLRLAIPSKRGGWIDLVRYTPWGLSGPVAESVEESPETALNPVVDQFAPQLSGAVAALGGEDPFGRELQVDPSEHEGVSDPSFLQQLGIAGYSALESYTPYLAQARRVREGGGTPYAGSTVIDPDVKPGSDHMSGLRRTFDPFRPTYLRAPGGEQVSMRSGDRRPRTRDERIDEALSRIDEAAALSGERDERINRALDLLP